MSVPIIFTLIVAISLSCLLSTSIEAQTMDDNDVNLVVDVPDYKDILPKNFRKTTDLTDIKTNKDINITGLDKLNISGSQQFSEKNLPLLIEAIGT